MTPAPLDPPLGPEDHVAGPDDAPYELVMYGDFQCPYCVAAQSIVRRVRERFDGRLRFAFRHMPLPALHPMAQKAAELSEAAAAQGRFWPMHDRLYAARGRLSGTELIGHAEALGLDVERVRAELAEGIHAARVERDERSARAAGVRGTPAFFVNGMLLDGAFDVGSLVAALQEPAAASSPPAS
jgi:Na+:H+ antiporter, NhaA family